MGHNIGVTVQPPQFVPAVEGHLLAQVVRQLGSEQFAAEQGVSGVAHVVRSDGAYMSRRVPWGVDDFKFRPAEGKGSILRWDDDVRPVYHAGGLPGYHPRREGEKITLQREQRGAHPSLRSGEGDLGLVFFL